MSTDGGGAGAARAGAPVGPRAGALRRDLSPRRSARAPAHYAVISARARAPFAAFLSVSMS
jgi:hypothetical protein